jgi:hypothetical protein
MSERENELLAAPADTPEGHGGTKSALDVDNTNPQESPLPADPPDGGGGTE